MKRSKHLVALILLTGNCCFATEQWERRADVLFSVQRTTDRLILTGKEKGKTSFNLNLKTNKTDEFTEFAKGNFTVTKLGDELKWRYVSKGTELITPKFYNVTVKFNGDMDLATDGQIYTGYDDKKTFAFKTNGKIVNEGKQAFHRLVIRAREFHNYGTIQSKSLSSDQDYWFNRGVIKLGEVPEGVEDLITEEERKATKDRKPKYENGVAENYGQMIVSEGTLEVEDGISYKEHKESAIENLRMYGGSIQVTNGSMNVRGVLSGKVKNIEVTCGGSLYAGKYKIKRKGYCITPQEGKMYTSEWSAREIGEKVEELKKEREILKKLERGKRITVGEAYKRYEKIKEGKERELYDRKTIERLKREHGEHWKEVVAMKLNGLQGGGNFLDDLGDALDDIGDATGKFLTGAVCVVGGTVVTAATGGAGAVAGGALIGTGLNLIKNCNKESEGFSIAIGGSTRFSGNPFSGDNNYNFAVGPTQESVNNQINMQKREEEERERRNREAVREVYRKIYEGGFNAKNINLSNIKINTSEYNSIINRVNEEERKRIEREERERREERWREEYVTAREDNRRRLQEELEKKRIYKSVTEYKPHNHGNRPTPTTVITNLYNINFNVHCDNVIRTLDDLRNISHGNKGNKENNHTKEDNHTEGKHNTARYWNNPQTVNKLYNTLRDNHIEHQDILTLYNHPFLNTITNWSNIPTDKKNIINKEYGYRSEWLANYIDIIKEEFEPVLSRTNSNIRPDTKNFINNFAIPFTAIAEENNVLGKCKSLLSRTVEKVVNVCHKYNDFTERAWEIGWLHSVYEDDDLMNAEERQAFKQWVINREIREKQNGVIEVISSVLNVTEVLGVTSSLKVFKPSLPLSETKAFKEAIKSIKTAPQKMENLIQQVRQGFNNIGDNLASTLHPTRQTVGNTGNIKTTVNPEINLNSDFYKVYNKGNRTTNTSSSHQTVNNPKPRVRATIEDANKYRDGLKEMGVLQRRNTRSHRECYEISKKCEYKGVKFKKHDLISRDTMHQEWEYFADKNTHMGAIDPIEGDIYKPKVTGRKLSLV